MVLSSAVGTGNQIAVSDTPKMDQQEAVKQISAEEVEMIMSTERYVKKYFSDIPIMIQIAKCESTFRQLDDNGEVHRGKINPEDVGVMQINEHYQLQTAIKKNYDIYTLEGNTAYARELYEKQGTAPWNSSKSCWGKYVSSAIASKSDSQDIAMNTTK